MLGSDGECYLCSPASDFSRSFKRIAITTFGLSSKPFGKFVALDALQVGVIEANKTLQGIVGRKFDA